MEILYLILSIWCKLKVRTSVNIVPRSLSRHQYSSQVTLSINEKSSGHPRSQRKVSPLVLLLSIPIIVLVDTSLTEASIRSSENSRLGISPSACYIKTSM